MRNALFVCVLCAVACATTPGRLEANRFQHTLYPYALFYPEGGRADAPLGPAYKLENFVAPQGQKLQPRFGGEFNIDRSYRDESPAVVGTEPFYDLLFSRDDPKARFWVRSVPLAVADEREALNLLSRRYLESVMASGRAAAPFGVEKSAESNPVGLRNVRASACELSKREALRVDFELEDPGARRTLDNPDWRAVSVVLVRTGYHARTRYPVLMLVGSESDEIGDPALERDFDRMLTALALGDKGQGLTMKGGHTCSPLSATGAAPPAAEETPAPASDTSGGERTPVLEVPIIQEDVPSEAVP